MENDKIMICSKFNPSDLIFGPPGRYQKGGKFVPLTYGPGKQRVYLQTPSLACPFGLGTFEDPRSGEKTYSVDVAFNFTDPRQRAFYDAMNELNEMVLSKAAECSVAWFGKPMSKGVLAEICRPLIKQPKDSKYSPTMRLKVPVVEGIPTPAIYNEAKELISLEAITKGSTIVCVMELRPVWFVNKTFGLTWQLVQAGITSSGNGGQKFVGYSFLEDF